MELISDEGTARTTYIAIRLNVPKMALLVVSVISFIICFFFIKTTTKMNIINQTKEIGILKALGVEKKKIGEIYLAENCSMYGFSSLFMFITIIIISILKKNGFLKFQGMDMFAYKFYLVIAVLVGGFLLVYLATCSELKRLNRINVTELIK